MALKQNWLGEDANCSIEVELNFISPDPPEESTTMNVNFNTKVNNILTVSGISSIEVAFTVNGITGSSATAATSGNPGEWFAGPITPSGETGPTFVTFTITDDNTDVWVINIPLSDTV